jgi:hypothetical protein
MPDIRISDLPAAAAALLAMEFEVNDAGVSRKVTLTQILAKLDESFLTPAEAGAAYQPLDTDLTALAALAVTGLLARTAAGAVAARTITGTANQVTVANGSGVAGNPTLSLPQDIHSGASPSFAGLSLGGLPAGAVIVAGSAGALTGDAAKLVWDAANKRLGLGVASPTVGFDYSAPTAPLMLREITAAVWDSPQSAVTIGLKNAGGIVDVGSGPSFLFRADNSAGAASFLGRLSGIWENRTAGAEAAAVVLSVRGGSADVLAQTEALRVTATRDLQLNGVGNTVITSARHHQLRSYTVATLPSVAGAAGQMIFVSNALGGPVPAYNDGASWRRCTDATVVS